MPRGRVRDRAGPLGRCKRRKTSAMTIDSVEPRGAEKKEAFFRAAEEKVHAFAFTVPDVEAPNRRINCYLAKTDSCSATILVLRDGYQASHHYHPNQDGIWVVLKGRVRFFGGADEKDMGEYGPLSADRRDVPTPAETLRKTRGDKPEKRAGLPF